MTRWLVFSWGWVDARKDGQLYTSEKIDRAELADCY
jgi:hypothetical protein